MKRPLKCYIKHNYVTYRTWEENPKGVISQVYKKCRTCEKIMKHHEAIISDGNEPKILMIKEERDRIPEEAELE